MNTKINKTVIVLMLSLSFSAFSQEKVAIVLLKGMAILQKSPSENIKIGRAEKLIMPINSSIVLSPNSSAIVYNSIAKIEVGSTKEQKFSFSQISASLKKNKPSSLTTNFIIYLDKMYADVEDKNNSYGASIGAASRGIEDDALAYLPVDDTIILSDSLVLSFGSEDTKLTSNIVVTNTTTNEVVYNEKPEINEVKLNGLKPGHYTWSYKFEYNGSKFTSQPPNTFIIPTSLEKASILKDIEDFKANLNDCSKSETCLSDSTKELLLNDFLEKNKYYITK